MPTNENGSFNCESKCENDAIPISANEEDSDDESFQGFLPSDFRLSMFIKHLHKKFRQRHLPPAMTKLNKGFLLNHEIVKKQLPGPTSPAMKETINENEKDISNNGEFLKSQRPANEQDSDESFHGFLPLDSVSSIYIRDLHQQFRQRHLPPAMTKHDKGLLLNHEIVKKHLPGPTSPAMKETIENEKDVSHNGEFLKSQLPANEQDSDDESFHGFLPLDSLSSIYIRDLHQQFRQRCIPPATTMEKSFSTDGGLVKIQFPVDKQSSEDKSFYGCSSYSNKSLPSKLSDSSLSSSIKKLKERFCQRQDNETMILQGSPMSTVDVGNSLKILSSAPAPSPPDKNENLTTKSYSSIVTVIASDITPALVEFLEKAEAEENLEIQSFELNDCDNVTETFAQKTLPKLVNLKRLRLVNANEKSPLISMLTSVSKMPNLSKLELINVVVIPGFDGALAKCSNLKSLLIVPTCKIKELAMVNRIVLEGIDRLFNTLKHCVWLLIKEMIANDHFHDCIPLNWDLDNCHEVMMTTFQFAKVITNFLPSIKIDVRQIPFSEIVQEVQRIQL